MCKNLKIYNYLTEEEQNSPLGQAGQGLQLCILACRISPKVTSRAASRNLVSNEP